MSKPEEDAQRPWLDLPGKGEGEREGEGGREREKEEGRGREKEGDILAVHPKINLYLWI